MDVEGKIEHELVRVPWQGIKRNKEETELESLQPLSGALAAKKLPGSDLDWVFIVPRSRDIGKCHEVPEPGKILVVVANIQMRTLKARGVLQSLACTTSSSELFW